MDHHYYRRYVSRTIMVVPGYCLLLMMRPFMRLDNHPWHQRLPPLDVWIRHSSLRMLQMSFPITVGVWTIAAIAAMLVTEYAPWVGLTGAGGLIVMGWAASVELATTQRVADARNPPQETCRPGCCHEYCRRP